MKHPDVEAVKAANPISQVLRDLGIDAPNGRFRCPRPENHSHGDRTPSVSVWPERGQFKCWVCPDVKGDVIDLVRIVKGCGFKEALEFLTHGLLGVPRTAGATVPTPAAPPSPDAPQRGPHAHRVSPDQTELFQPAIPAIPTALAASQSEPLLEIEPLKLSILAALLERSEPLRGKAARYLQKRRIFKRTWDAQRLRVIEDYAALNRDLIADFGLADLERAGFFNAAGHLRFYRHRLLFPYFDSADKAVYVQGRAIEKDVTPKELSLPGPIPLPYNARLLDGQAGHVYLCEGVIDTLTLLEQGFAAVGVPGAANFKPAWVPLFQGKTVHLVFDADAAGEAGAAKTLALLTDDGIDAKRFQLPSGEDINDWFLGGKHP